MPPKKRRPPLLDPLESRLLLSAALFPHINSTHTLALIPNESAIISPKYADQWYLNNTGQTITTPISGPATGFPGADIDAHRAWDLTTGSNNVVVAVFDTGIDLTHPDLVGNIWNNPGETPGNGIDDDHNGFVDDIHGWNFVNNNNNVQDNSATSHGTTVAGVIGATGNNSAGIAGVNWHVSILPVKVGTDLGVTSQSLIDGINYVINLKNHGVNVVAINASYVSFTFLSLAEINAISNAGNAGLLYVAAAGNSGLNLDTLIPGSFLPSNMMLVAATDNRDRLASFSNYGGGSVALGAPGVDIQTTLAGGFYAVVSGTSYAAPMVAATAALMKAYVPAASMTQIKNAILNSGDPVASLQGTTISGRRLNAYYAIETLLGERLPTGVLNRADATVIAGWAFDANAGSKSIPVQLYIDGVLRSVATANVTRNDLTALLGSPKHGYSFATPTLSPGVHTVQVYAVDYSVGTSQGHKLLGTKTIFAPGPPIGAIESASATKIIGWAIDPDAPTTSVNVRLDIDGVTFDVGTANLIRNDLVPTYGSANHGYSFNVAGFTPGIHRADVYAIDTTTGIPKLIGSRLFDTNHSPVGAFSQFNGSTLTGWAFDSDAGSTPISILYQIDNNAPWMATASINRPDLSGLGSTNHGFSITLPQLAAGTHTVKVWAIDSTTKTLTSLGARSATVASPAGNALPTGSLDPTSLSAPITGWVFDPSTAAPIRARLDPRGTTTLPFTANVVRTDLAALGSANHGFRRTISSSTAYILDAYALDAATATPTLFASRIITNSAPPQGALNISATTAAGWLFSPDLGAGSTQFRLLIDGLVGPAALAQTNRPDLAFLGSTNHGFSVSLPSLPAGTHTVTLQYLNPFTLQPTNVVSQSITV